MMQSSDNKEKCTCQSIINKYMDVLDEGNQK